MVHWAYRGLSILSLVSVLGCGSNPGADTVSGPQKLYGDIGAERSYCSTTTSYSPSTTITATAQYRYRVVSRSQGLTGAATGNIRYAEVRVLDGSGNTIQCGETDGSGNISLSVPRTAGTYSLVVYSRADNSYAKVSVLNNPTSMTPYSIRRSFSLTGAETTLAVTLSVADHANTLEGGAFNILEQIVKSNEYIRNNSTCASLGNVCTAFTVAPKVRVFWSAGLSPGAYYSEPTASISFYIAEDEPAYGMATGIYLMGGINGSICVDTDHFDNSVIIHEYGHYLEKAFADSDSPGGSHNGNSVIDPRLAWSEGWSNFLQGAVRSDRYYVDTKGNTDCSVQEGGTGVTVALDMENILIGQDTVNGSSYLGEGIFREVSVSRTLWDTMENKMTGSDNFGANVGFAYIWKIFSSATGGFKSSNVHFRNIGHFNELMRSLIANSAPSSLSDFDALVLNERQRSDRREYAHLLTAQTSVSCTFDLQGINGVRNLASTNDFFAYYYDGTPGRAIINLRYSAVSSGTPSDLDLYVWNESHAFNDTTTLAGQSTRYYPEASGTGIETISLSGRGAGYYLIQVATDPESVNNPARYYLETNGGSERLCPPP